MKDKVLYVIAAVVYLVILLGFVAVVMSTSDSDTIAMAGSAVSAALMLLTLIFGIVLLRKNDSERYKEMFIKDETNDDDEK